VIFALFCIVARLLHRYFLYIPDPKRVDPHEAGLTGVEEIVFKSAEGKKLIAWYRPAAKGKRTLLYFPGNSGNVAARAGKIKAIVADGYGVFIVNYRGSGGSASRPSEKRIVRDAVTAYDTLRGLGVPPRATSCSTASRSALASRPRSASSVRPKVWFWNRRSPLSWMWASWLGRFCP